MWRMRLTAGYGLGRRSRHRRNISPFVGQCSCPLPWYALPGRGLGVSHHGGGCSCSFQTTKPSTPTAARTVYVHQGSEVTGSDRLRQLLSAAVDRAQHRAVTICRS
jgi:hypothetical protein